MVFLVSVCYAVFSCMVVYPSASVRSAGLSIPQLFGSWLPNEADQFVNHHLYRGALVAVVHATLPLCYALLLLVSRWTEEIEPPLPAPLAAFIATAFVGFATVAYEVCKWFANDSNEHPSCRSLARYCTPDASDWRELAANIDTEFKSVDKLSLTTNNITKTIVTTNWIVYVGFYHLYFVRQNDAIMIVKDSDTHHLSHVTGGEQQFINIEVRSEQANSSVFHIRLNSFDFKDLQSKVIKPIIVLPHIVFHKTIIDKFIDTFKEQISLNIKYKTQQELEPCIGCMQARANVKLIRRCNITIVERNDDEIIPLCKPCGCRPMWCVDCMGRWFATRQDPDQPEHWLSSKCTCPLCRQTFCIYDVCLIDTNTT